ncbi:MAG TPA: hypothetical protein VFC78_07280 [Tepidisphaeraceae bacterium]|nr:hypothetical protein [Tepidisphaeraceae bacterium]
MIWLFLASVTLTVISSYVLAHALDRLGARLGFSEGLMGLLNALGANAPEISAAVTALLAHNRDVGVGVVIGSNIFNLAALMGLSAAIAGQVRISRSGLALNGSVALAVTVVLLAMLWESIGPGASLVIMGVIMCPYVVLMALRPHQVKRLIPTHWARSFLAGALEHAHRDARTGQTPRRAVWIDFMSIIPALASIVLGSVRMVKSAILLGGRWGISDAVVGTLVLATLTSLPNALTAIRLALHKRGSVVVSETFNSNTLNIIAGICVPAFVIGLGKPSQLTLASTYWLLGLTVFTLLLTWTGRGLRRREGLAIIGVYALFAAWIIRR